jgi:hypothetical protein
VYTTGLFCPDLFRAAYVSRRHTCPRLRATHSRGCGAPSPQATRCWVRAAAAELNHVELDDALAICLVLLDREPERYEPAAVRFLGRRLVERRSLTLADAEHAAGWLADLDGRKASRRGALGLAELCDDVGLERAAEGLRERLERS